ncbi:MAG: hypothetical protein AAF614_44395 [Chloroflexota bacterium]
MNLTFKLWLLKQTERQDQIGKLARVMSQIEDSDVPQRKANEHKKWADLVIQHGQPEHVRAFNHAWREYQTATG